MVFGDKTYHQINATIIKNISRDAFINGEYNNDLIDYHVLGIGGAAILLSFLGCTMEECYSRIPYHIFQWIRENCFQKLYDGTDRFENELSHWAIDALMEL